MKKFNKKTVVGFTLIEVMIALAVVAILVAIAVPNYNNYVLKAKRSIAKTALTSIASKQETYRMDNKEYGTLTELGYGGLALFVDSHNNIGIADNNSLYSISMAVVKAAHTFTITALPKNAQANDSKCTEFTLNELGVKGNGSGESVLACW